MKFTKPTKKSGTDTAVLVTTAATGAMLYNGLVGLILPNGQTLTSNAIGAIVTGLLSASKLGTGKTSDALKGLFAGMSINSAMAVVKEIAQKNIDTTKIKNEKFREFVSDTFGLSGGLNGAVEFLPFGDSNQDFAPLWENNNITQPESQFGGLV